MEWWFVLCLTTTSTIRIVHSFGILLTVSQAGVITDSTASIVTSTIKLKRKGSNMAASLALSSGLGNTCYQINNSSRANATPR